MPLSKLAIAVAELGAARRLSDRLGNAESPAALAVSTFEIPETKAWRVEAYYPETPDRLALLELLAGHIGDETEIALEDVPDENWVAISQAALPPVAAGRFIVHGSHDRAAIGFRLNAIEIDAGEAFGTAHHATTRGCLDALDRMTRRHRPGRVLDLGCGSGVLAIAAARTLPKARILASDIDAEAVRVAHANARANRAGARIPVHVATGLDHPALRGECRFDLVLANILAGPLIRLAPALRRAIAPKGIAILSGILAEQADEVAAAYRAQSFHVTGRWIDTGWATLVVTRRGLARRSQR